MGYSNFSNLDCKENLYRLIGQTVFLLVYRTITDERHITIDDMYQLLQFGGQPQGQGE